MSTPTEETRGRRPDGLRGGRRTLLAASLVALASLLVYLPTLGSAFVDWDDDIYVYNNPFVRRFDATLLRHAFLGFHAANWHPVTWLSHAADVALWGLNPAGHHLTSLLLHAANAFLVVVLVARLAGFCAAGEAGAPARAAGAVPALPAAVCAGLLFGLHPLRVESVAWVSERKDLLCALFFLLAQLAYTAYVAAGRAGRAAPALRDPRYLAALGLYALALMSKPMAVSLPAVLLLLDWLLFRRARGLRPFLAAAVEKLPFLLLGLAAGVLTLAAQRGGGAAVTLADIPAAARAIAAAKAPGVYLWRMLLPVRLVPFYPHTEGLLRLSAGTLLPVALTLGLTAHALVAARRGRCVWPAAWGWYLLTLAPVLGIVQVGRQATADRYTYLPGLGPAVLAGVALSWLWQRAGAGTPGRRTRAARAALVAAAAAAGLAFSAATVAQQAVWKDSLSLWDAVIEREPLPLAFAYHNRAVALARAGRIGQAIADYGRANAIDPGDARVLVNRGLLLVQTGRIGDAVADFRAACDLGNDFACRAAEVYRARGAPFPGRPRD